MTSLTNIRGTVASDHLDLARGLAAVAVLWTHARVLLFSSLDHVQHTGLPVKMVYFSSRFGHQAVIIFFVLSGFFIGSSVLRDFNSRRFSWTGYLTARSVRLYLVLIPGLLLTTLIDRASCRLASDDVSPSPDTSVAIIDYDKIEERSTPATLLGNALFLQEVLVPAYGSNTALWSLSYEFWYYLLFPAITICIATAGWPRVAYAVAVAVIFWFVGVEIAAYFAIWMLGVGVALAKPIQWLSPRRASYVSAMLIAKVGLFMAAMKVRPLGSEFIRDLITGLGVASIVFAILHCNQPTRAKSYSNAAAMLAGFSFTLYVIHLPILILCRSLWTNENPWQPDATHLMWAASIMLGIMGFAFCLAWVTERNTNEVRSVVTQLFHRIHKPANG